MTGSRNVPLALQRHWFSTILALNRNNVSQRIQSLRSIPSSLLLLRHSSFSHTNSSFHNFCNYKTTTAARNPSKPTTTPPSTSTSPPPQPLPPLPQTFTTSNPHPRFAIMATNDDAAIAQHTRKEFPAPPSLESLNERLQSLAINDPLPVYANSNPTSNPVDIYRCYIAHNLAPITGVDISLVYPALEWTQTLDKGDLIVAAPRLRIKGRKPDELAKEWAEKVSRHLVLLDGPVNNLTTRANSSPITHTPSAPVPTVPSCASTSRTAF
jgi:hypothetical protein